MKHIDNIDVSDDMGIASMAIPLLLLLLAMMMLLLGLLLLEAVIAGRQTPNFPR